ncbi:MAG: Ig-like domain-containing protein [Bacteroidota bacterium]
MKKISSFTRLLQAIGLPSFLLALVFFSITRPAFGQTLVWEENFNAAVVNPNSWTYDFGDGSERAAGLGWGNSELEYYTSRTQNVRTEAGSLVIEARRENFGNSAFTSGRIKTEGRIHFKYGTVEARIKLPNMANGLWPAFWTLGTIGPAWPGIGEIDMMEAGSAGAIQAGLVNKRITSATHWSNNSNAHQYNTSSIDAAVDLSLDYHLYKMVWTSQYIKMYLDNVEYYSLDISSNPVLSEFHTPHYLLLNVAVGGAYVNIFDANAITAPLPGKMYVDYVKLWQNAGDELIVGTDNNPASNFGILTENTPVTDSLTYGTNATLYYWNNISNISNPVAFEGNALWAVHANAGDWFGMGVDNNYINLSSFETGSLKFRFKTSYSGQFKIGIKTGHGESWLNFPAGASKYGMTRDGSWHEVTIPVTDFINPSEGRNVDLLSVKSAFMFAGDPASSAADFYFDDIHFFKTPTVLSESPLTAAPTPPVRNAADVISVFSGAYTELAGTDWFPNWGQTTVVSDTTIVGNLTKKYTAFNYQGVQFASAIDASGMTKLHIDIWTPNAITFEVYPIVPGQPEVAKQLMPTVSGWNSFDIDLATIGTTPLSNIIQFKFVGVPGGSRVYLDNIYFWRPAPLSASPLTAAPTPPARAASDVISLFSGAYTEVAGTDWFPNWGQSTVVSDTTIEGNLTKKYVDFNYQGVQFLTPVNASGMTKLHIDIWTPNAITFDVYPIVDGQPEVAKQLTPTVSGWNSFDIDLATIGTTGLNNIKQFKFVGTPGGSRVYLDNIYFYTVPVVISPYPLTAAPTPPARTASNVISLFSGAYAEVAGTDWFPNWGQSTVVSDTTIEGNLTKKYVNLNYQGVQFQTPINAAAMTKLHLDIWTPNAIAFDVYPIVDGQPEVAKQLTPTVSGWNSYDIDLATIGTTGLNNIKQFKFVGTPGGSRVYLDNIYFWKDASVVLGVAPTVTITSPANNTNLIAPATVMIAATAGDADGTVTKVEFYNGDVLLGEDLSSPYNYEWNNIAAGNYTITAKVTDNDNNVIASTPIAIVVKPAPCTGTAVSGDYSYEVYTQAGKVYFTFHPLAPIAGSNLAILNLKEGGGGYAGYGMTASGSDFTFNRTIANGVSTTFFFTYNTPPAGEKNSSADPHSYFVGTVCVPGAPTVSITSPIEGSSYTTPATITINATAADANGTITKVEFYNGATLLGMDEISPYSFEWTNVAAGNYILTAKSTDNDMLSTSSTPVQIVVNAPNLNGFCGTAASGDYEYKAETNNGIVTFRFHPLTPIEGSQYAVINLTANGAQNNSTMSAAGTDFVYSTPLADGVVTSFYFTYNTPPGGERNSSANKHSYIVGTNCLGITESTPVATITSPVNDASFTEPATITIDASAADNDGTVSKVEFYNGATLLGTDNTAPYSFDWTNAPAGNYTISAKATDNDGYTGISNLVKIVVGINNAGGFCGTVANGDYSYKAETIDGKVVITFHPLAPILGSNSALIYVREGLNGGYPGYPMTKIGSDFRFTKTIAEGTPISIYFTYNTPLEGGERNSSATPHSYTVGDVCVGGAPLISITSPAQSASFAAPATITITADATDANGTITKVEFYNGNTLIGMDDTAPYSFEWLNVAAGSYTLKAKATDNNALASTSPPINISVNTPNTNGYCGTAVSGDYEYKAETLAGVVTYTFHPLAPIAGSNLAIIYIKEGNGGFPGYGMTASGTDFTFSKPIADGVTTTFYFTYNTPPAGERNSSANPHIYVVGTNCTGLVLPVTLVSFTATKTPAGSIAITWTTTNEIDSDKFIIEKSIDGTLFTAFTSVKANAHSSNSNVYNIIDNTPANGRNYYRLTQVDRNGTKTSFGIRLVNLGDQNSTLTLYPNPLTGTQVFIKTAEASGKKIHVQILGITGNRILNGVYTQQGDLINVMLPFKPAPGVYLVKVDGYNTLKLIVN